MAYPLKLAVVGAGLVGLRHIAAIGQVRGIELAAVVEPGGGDFGVPKFGSLIALLDDVHVDGVILSTPTLMHVDGGVACVERGIPVLIEKPLAASSVDAVPLVQMAESRSVSILVGHHRRHNPVIQKAADLLQTGAIGDIRAAHVTCWFYKPDDYFAVAPWRTKQGAGPISVNLVHDVDLLRAFMGEVATVQAQMSPSKRGFENEDLAAAILRFESGAIATITVSDSIASPWSWELTSGEYPIYPKTNQSSYLIGGSEGSLSVPDLQLWRHDGDTNWWNPISATSMPREASDPLVNQIKHFADVIRGDSDPAVSGAEGLRTLQVVEAIQKAAETQELIRLNVRDTPKSQAAE